MVLNSWQWRLFFLALTLLLGSFATGHLLEISDLGRGTSIGALYDVVTGEILDVALWSNNVTNSSDLVRTIPAHYARLSFTRSERTEDRASLQSLSGEVTGSILGGFLSVKGSALVLEHKRRSRSTAEVVANYHIETRKTVINAYDPRLCKEQLQVGEFPGLKRATHVVTGILYGGDCAAIFSTESASRFDKSADLTKIEGEIDFWLGSYTQTLVERDDIKESSSASSSITVEIFGDLLPEGPLPGDVESAVRFMSAMPQQMVSQGDLPKRLFLTPLSELPCDEQAGRRLERATLQHYFELPDRFVTLSIRLLEELDTAEQCLNELSLRPHRGFISLRQAIHCHLENLQDYRKQFRQQLKESTQAFRNDGAEQKLDYLVQSFYESGYSLQETQSLCNKLQTKWSTADDVADFMEQSNLQMGNHISDFIGPSLNPRVHSAYQFLFVGEPDSVENRESVKLLKDFAHLAGQRKRVSGSSCDDCEPVSFSAIQFDSFCLQFCRPEQCQLWCKNCGEGTDLSNSTASSDLVFLMPQQESWCEVPQSRVLLSVRNAQPQVVNVQHIQPPSSLDLLEVRYNGHEIELILGNQSSCAPPVLRHVLRVSWETKEDSMHLYSQHRDFEIYAPEDAARIVLDAGRVYSFQVAAVNQVGIGPFSSKRRAMATSTSSERRLAAFAGLFGLPVPVVGLLASREAVLSLPETKRNRVPSWRCVQVTISLSSDTQEEISGVRFSDAENVHQNLTCAARMSSYNEIHCTIPTRKTSVDILWNVEVLGFDRPIAELGHLLQEAPSVQACREWSQADYCHSIEPTCVKTCADCAARPHAHAPPNCSSVDAGHYWSELTGVPVNGNRQDEADFELENGEVCPLEPEPYWKEDASFRRLTPTHRPAPASLVLDIRLWRSEVAASCQATSQVAPDKCSRQVVRAVPSPIQQLRDQLNSSVLLIMEAWLMVPEATVFSKDPETLRMITSSLLNAAEYPHLGVQVAMEPIWVQREANVRAFFAFSLTCWLSASCLQIRPELETMLSDLAEAGILVGNLTRSLQQSGYSVTAAGQIIHSANVYEYDQGAATSTTSSTRSTSHTITSTSTNTNTSTSSSSHFSTSTLNTRTSTTTIQNTTTSTSASTDTSTSSSSHFSTSTFNTRTNTDARTSSSSHFSTSTSTSLTTSITNSRVSIFGTTPSASTSTESRTTSNVIIASTATTQNMATTSATAEATVSGDSHNNEAVAVLELGLTLSDISSFDLEGFQREMSEALGVSAENVLLTSVRYQTSVTLSLGSVTTAEQAQVALADLLDIHQDSISVTLLGARRLNSLFIRGRLLASVTLEAVIRTEDLQSTASTAEIFANMTTLSEAFDVGVSVLVSPATIAQIALDIQLPPSITLDMTEIKESILEETGFNVSIYSMEMEEALDSPQSTSDSIDSGLNAVEETVDDSLPMVLIGTLLASFLMMILVCCMACRRWLRCCNASGARDTE